METLLTAVTLFLLFLPFAQCSSAQTASHVAAHCSADRDSTVPYPESLKGSGIQGNVLVEAIVDTKGCTRSVRVVRKLYPELDKLAVQLVNSWKFEPAKKDGKAVAVIVRAEVQFKDPQPKQ